MRKYLKETDDNKSKKRVGEERTTFDTVFYWFLIFICWMDVLIACRVI